MEKLIYALWARNGNRETLNQALLGPVSDALGQHARVLRINVQDEEVASGNSPRSAVTQPQMDAFVQLWVDSVYGAAPQIEKVLGKLCDRIEGWLVTEATIIPNSAHRAEPGGRTPGFSQMVMLTRPEELSHDEWRRNWQNDHTRVGIETQSNFEYIQNLVARPLTNGDSKVLAIVEECFPIEALNDPAVFYDAVGDSAKQARNVETMMASCARFIPQTGCDCIPTSQYDLISLT
ncbi:EthD domain-containing protein [Croceicoccus sp. F390]|uniref:EthD domain-containing protein n=1 Tax=Croceicoccus esteveae TaxID=3075597 RepID=A0ABU2ZFI2_9SPHN|nr:EthD domain-containing protein [Croceicoccus sp. F390]MDT0574971.1 EthD domain-containing protein [Croceicoccus sp. F390]